MANSSIESIVRELLKVVTTLNTKVSTLEHKIDDQNALLVQQAQAIKLLTGSSTLDPVSKTPALDQAAAQRPLRAAREKATTALSAASLTRIAKTKKIDDGTKSPLSYSNVSAKVPELDNATKTVATKSAIMSAERKTNTILADNNEDENWTKVRRNRRQRTNKITVGEGTEDAELQAVENMKFIQAWSFTPNTTSEMIRKFLNKIQLCEHYYVEKRILKTDRHASFIIGIPENIFNMFNSPTVWPQRVRFSNWFLRQPRAERGDNVTH